MSTWKIDPAHTDVTFSVKHMMVTTVRGKFGEVSGELELDLGEGIDEGIAVGGDLKQACKVAVLNDDLLEHYDGNELGLLAQEALPLVGRGSQDEIYFFDSFRLAEEAELQEVTLLKDDTE